MDGHFCDNFIMTEDGENFEMTQTTKGDPGEGVPTGGTAGQVLKKVSDDDYDTEWADNDAGDVGYDSEETYQSGTVGKTLNDLSRQLSDVSGSLATVETTSTASKAYAVGDLLVYNNQLYKVASAIAAGGTLTPGTNITAVTVESELDGKQNVITGNFGDSLTFDVNSNLVLFSKQTAERYVPGFSFNKFSALFKDYLICFNSASPRGGVTIANNIIRLPFTASGSTTRRFFSLLSNDGTCHEFGGSYNTENIPIDNRAWINIDDLFNQQLSADYYLESYCGSRQKAGNVSFGIYVYFGFKDGSGNITSKQRLTAGYSFYSVNRTSSITPYITDPENYNVMAIYADLRNGVWASEAQKPIYVYLDLDVQASI